MTATSVEVRAPIPTQGEAAERSAREHFERVASTSPQFAAAVTGVPREIVLNLMAQCFLDGIVDGAQRVAGGLFSKPVQP